MCKMSPGSGYWCMCIHITPPWFVLMTALPLPIDCLWIYDYSLLDAHEIIVNLMQFCGDRIKVLHIAFYSNGLKMSLHLSMVWLHAFHSVRVTIYNISCAAPVTWIILRMGSANERRPYNVTSYFIGPTHTQNGPCAKYTGLPYLCACYHLTMQGHQTTKEFIIFLKAFSVYLLVNLRIPLVIKGRK